MELNTNSVFIFGREKIKVTREKIVEFWNFGRETKKVPVKKTEKSPKSTRENCFLPVKIFKNYAREKWNSAREKNQEFCPLKVQKSVKIPEILGVKPYF